LAISTRIAKNGRKLEIFVDHSTGPEHFFSIIMSRKRKLAAAFLTVLAVVSTVLLSEPVKNRNSRLSGAEYYLELMSISNDMHECIVLLDCPLS